MNTYGTSAEESRSLAITLLRAQQTGQCLLDVEKSREQNRRISHSSTVRYRFGVAGIALAIVAMLLCTNRCFGQSTFGSIRGTVQDVSGAVIPDARLRCIASMKIRTAWS